MEIIATGFEVVKSLESMLKALSEEEDLYKIELYKHYSQIIWNLTDQYLQSAQAYYGLPENIWN